MLQVAVQFDSEQQSPMVQFQLQKGTGSWLFRVEVVVRVRVGFMLGSA